jgi:hypothetical protein
MVVTVSAGVGTLLGAVAGYFGGALDDVISRVTDTLLAFRDCSSRLRSWRCLDPVWATCCSL